MEIFYFMFRLGSFGIIITTINCMALTSIIRKVLLRNHWMGLWDTTLWKNLTKGSHELHRDKVQNRFFSLWTSDCPSCKTGEWYFPNSLVCYVDKRMTRAAYRCPNSAPIFSLCVWVLVCFFHKLSNSLLHPLPFDTCF